METKTTTNKIKTLTHNVSRTHMKRLRSSIRSIKTRIFRGISNTQNISFAEFAAHDNMCKRYRGEKKAKTDRMHA